MDRKVAYLFVTFTMFLVSGQWLVTLAEASSVVLRAYGSGPGSHITLIWSKEGNRADNDEILYTITRYFTAQQVRDFQGGVCGSR